MYPKMHLTVYFLQKVTGVQPDPVRCGTCIVNMQNWLKTGKLSGGDKINESNESGEEECVRAHTCMWGAR